jgi:hypothetical protein
MAMKLTLEILNAAKSCLGGYSDKQFALIGIVRPIPIGWRKKTVGHEFPDADIKLFVSLKDAHLTPDKIRYHETRKAKNKLRREAETRGEFAPPPDKARY